MRKSAGSTGRVNIGGRVSQDLNTGLIIRPH